MRKGPGAASPGPRSRRRVWLALGGHRRVASAGAGDAPGLGTTTTDARVQQNSHCGKKRYSRVRVVVKSSVRPWQIQLLRVSSALTRQLEETRKCHRLAIGP